MGAIRAKDTSPEIAVRRYLFSQGYRFRLHKRNLPGRPDIVFPRMKKAIFVHGCFWHAHGCALANIPKSNRDFWLKKFNRNRERDQRKLDQLTALGWKVLVIWECEIGVRKKMGLILDRFLG